MPPSQTAAQLESHSTPHGLEVRLSGRLDAAGVAILWERAAHLAAAPGPGLRVEATHVEYCDGSGLALLLEMRRLTQGRGAQFSLHGLAPRFQALLDQFAPEDVAPATEPERHGLIEEVGRKTAILLDDLAGIVAFVGEFCAAFVAAAARPRRIRWRDALHVAETTGANALPIIVLIGFLMGLIMAFQSAMPLKQFGAEIFVANLLGLSILRELGPLVTAIILAGRTGSAFAAELGTMSVGEELDAMRTMGLDPVRFLVVTRVGAAMAVTPLLTIFFDVAALTGGALVMLSLGYPLAAFLHQAQMAVGMKDLLGGLFKACAFSLLVCAVGCQRGLRTHGGASSVGGAATSAVVAGIILIAVADGVFAVMFYVLGW